MKPTDTCRLRQPIHVDLRSGNQVPGLGRRIALDVARGLHFLHTNRIVHMVTFASQLDVSVCSLRTLPCSALVHAATEAR